MQESNLSWVPFWLLIRLRCGSNSDIISKLLPWWRRHCFCDPTWWWIQNKTCLKPRLLANRRNLQLENWGSFPQKTSVSFQIRIQFSLLNLTFITTSVCLADFVENDEYDKEITKDYICTSLFRSNWKRNGLTGWRDSANAAKPYIWICFRI